VLVFLGFQGEDETRPNHAGSVEGSAAIYPATLQISKACALVEKSKFQKLEGFFT
jgi:hypothetical protein